MELTASRRPFLYFPLRHHFERNFHVAHRLDRYGAGRRMEFDTATPDVIAAGIAEEIGRTVNYRASRPMARVARPRSSPSFFEEVELEDHVQSAAAPWPGRTTNG
jgi:UDP:flavonoid glycosyltransferase YjiC (YdhE family)